MIRIRTGVLIFIIVAALISGALAVFVVEDIGFPGFVADDGSYVRVTKEAYDDYKHYVDKYGKAELLKKYVKDQYYIDVDEEALDEGVYYGIFDSLKDPYSTYMSAKEYEEENRTTIGVYGGIGITFTTDIYNDLVILKVNPESPASDAGFQPGDRIVKVDGIEYDGTTQDEAAEAMRGEAGSTVKVTIRRGEVVLDFTLTRRKIVSKTVEHKMLDDNIGYIAISSFDMTTYNDFKAALNSIEAEKPDGLIVDLRDNGGGLVDIAISCVDELMDSGTIVYIEDNKGNREYYKSKNGRTKLPYVVLVNEDTASASEIISSGIQSNKEGSIVGTKTYGKGIIQITDPLTDGTAVKITKWQYFSANGDPIHKVGITPDYIVELTDDCYDPSTLELIDDRQLKKALELLGVKPEEAPEDVLEESVEELEEELEPAA